MQEVNAIATEVITVKSRSSALLMQARRFRDIASSLETALEAAGMRNPEPESESTPDGPSDDRLLGILNEAERENNRSLNRIENIIGTLQEHL